MFDFFVILFYCVDWVLNLTYQVLNHHFKRLLFLTKFFPLRTLIFVKFTIFDVFSPELVKFFEIYQIINSLSDSWIKRKKSRKLECLLQQKSLIGSTSTQCLSIVWIYVGNHLKPTADWPDHKLCTSDGNRKTTCPIGESNYIWCNHQKWTGQLDSGLIGLRCHPLNPKIRWYKPNICEWNPFECPSAHNRPNNYYNFYTRKHHV